METDNFKINMLVTLILSIILMAAFFLMLFAAVALVQDRRLLKSAPRDVQAAMLEHKEPFCGARAIGWTLFIIAILLFPAVSLYGAWDGLRHDFSFWQFAGRFLVMLYLLKAFDIIFCDWFLLTKSHFFQHFYPETEGCAGYHQFGFNRKEQLVRIVVFPFVALFEAWICTLF